MKKISCGQFFSRNCFVSLYSNYSWPSQITDPTTFSIFSLFGVQLPSLPVIPSEDRCLGAPLAHLRFGSTFRGSFHTSSEGMTMTRGFWKTSVMIGDKLIPPLIGHPYNGALLTPTDLGWWVYPLTQGTNGAANMTHQRSPNVHLPLTEWNFPPWIS